MHEQDMAIVKALVPVAWADGHFAQQEREVIDALLDAYNASDAEKAELYAYAKDKKTLDDIQLENLSAADRRVVLQHAVLLSFVDGEQHEAELALLHDLAKRLKIAEAERDTIFETASARARQFLTLL